MITSAPCMTDRLSLFAGHQPPPHLPPHIAEHIHRAFGTESHAFAELTGADALIDEDHQHLWAEIDYVIQNEMPMTVADVLARRTRIALIARDHGRAVVPAVADRLGTHLGWTRAEREDAAMHDHGELADYAFTP